jgi:TfoX/Sxy family transcriptional regulator of competence genes
MAWIKVPPENRPLFQAALPKDPRVTTINMFGGVAAMVNGNIFAGLFARSIIAKLSEADWNEAMAIDGSAPFDPMGTGRVMGNTVLMGESVMDEPAELRSWLQRAFDFVKTKPPKVKTSSKKSPSKKSPSKKSPSKKVPSKKSPSKKSPSKKSPSKKVSSKKVSSKKVPSKKSPSKKSPSKN